MQVNTNYTLNKKLRVERLIASYSHTANYIKTRANTEFKNRIITRWHCERELHHKHSSLIQDNMLSGMITNIKIHNSNALDVMC